MDVAAFQPTQALSGAKWAFTTRRVIRQDVAGISTDLSNAVSGDLVLGQIIEIGQHKKIQLAEGRFSESYMGDHVVLTCGDRYAPDQFEAVAELNAEGADIVAGGGVVGRMRAAHMRMAAPTKIKPIGLLIDRNGEVINIARYALPQKSAPKNVTVIGVVGASMNAGKTTAAASIAHGLYRAGFRVAAVKATGTGAFGDFHAYRDAGVPLVSDFTDAGMSSTYRQPLDRIEQAFETLIAHAAEDGAEIVVVELADGLFQDETSQLLRDSIIREALSGVLFAAPDALGAVGGVSILRQLGIVPLAVSGMVSCSPLAVKEAQAVIQIPVVSRNDLRDPEFVTALVQGLIVSHTNAGSTPLIDLKPAA